MSSKKHMMQAAAGAADTFVSIPWDVSNATYDYILDQFFVREEESVPEAVTFNDDGTKMYICGSNTDSVNEYNLDTAWDITTATHSSTFSVLGYGTNPTGIFFKPDGTEMYVSVTSANGVVPADSIVNFSLSTAWDISTATYSTYLDVGTQEANPQDVFFKPDGTKLYVIGVGGDEVNEWNLSTAWDISTASVSALYSVASQDINPSGLHFKSDGTKMYIIGYNSDSIYEYDLSTAWSVNTPTLNQSLSIADRELSPNGLTFNDDGTKMYIIGQGNDTIFKYDLSTAWDISTALWNEPESDYVSIANHATSALGLFFKPDGTKMFIADGASDSIIAYNLSTAWDLTTASVGTSASIGSVDTAINGVSFKPDGTEMYFVGSQTDSVRQFNVSPAWEHNNSGFFASFDVSTYTTSPADLFLGNSGSALYVIGKDSSGYLNVFEFDLSSSYNISSASHIRSTDLSSNTPDAQGLFFKDDGTKLYLLNNPNSLRSVDEYELSTAWDTSTATYSQRIDISPQSPRPTSIYFKDDGTEMYIVDNALDAVLNFHL